GGGLNLIQVRTLRLRGLRAVEKPRRAALICGCVDFPDFGELAAVVLAVRLLVGLERAGLVHRSMFVYPSGGVVVEDHGRSRPTRRGGTGGLCANRLGGSGERYGALAAVHSGLRPGLYRGPDPACVHVDCAGPVREDVPSHSLLGEGLTGENNRLKRGL